MTGNLLIVSKKLQDHEDPTWGGEFTYCCGNKRLLDSIGKHVFFHETLNDRNRYIIGYFVVKDAGLGVDMVRKHDVKGDAKHAEHIDHHYVLVGDKNKSIKLKDPIKLNRKLARQLEFVPNKPIKFDKTNKNGRELTDLECISSATRAVRFLSTGDVDLLFDKIK